MEMFIQRAPGAEGDFWIGLRRKQGYKESGAADCSSQYYWLDHSQATYRNWQLNKPSCGTGQCVALYYNLRAPASLFKWSDFGCKSKNNFICKYAEEISVVPTPVLNSTARSVSFSDEAINVSYILLATVPALLLIILAGSGVLCYRVMTR
ncbi:layilin-like isoform X2, partial [Clarias magur]